MLDYSFIKKSSNTIKHNIKQDRTLTLVKRIPLLFIFIIKNGLMSLFSGTVTSFSLNVPVSQAGTSNCPGL